VTEYWNENNTGEFVVELGLMQERHSGDCAQALRQRDSVETDKEARMRTYRGLVSRAGDSTSRRHLRHADRLMRGHYSLAEIQASQEVLAGARSHRAVWLPRWRSRSPPDALFLRCAAGDFSHVSKRQFTSKGLIEEYIPVRRVFDAGDVANVNGASSAVTMTTPRCGQSTACVVSSSRIKANIVTWKGESIPFTPRRLRGISSNRTALDRDPQFSAQFPVAHSIGTPRP